MDSDDALCEDMRCPFLFRQPDCSPARCRAADLARKQVGAIFMLDGSREEAFVALLPGRSINH